METVRAVALTREAARRLRAAALPRWGSGNLGAMAGPLGGVTA